MLVRGFNAHLMEMDCIRAPPKRGRYWEIHPQRPRDFPRAKISPRFPQDFQDFYDPILAIWGVPEMALRVPESKL